MILNSLLIDNLYLVYLYPQEFPLFYNEKKSKSSEFFIILMASLSLSISLVYLSRSYMDISISIVLFFFLLNIIFFNIYPSVLAYLIDFDLRKNEILPDLNQLVTFIRYSSGSISFILPLSFFGFMINLKGGGSLLFLLIFVFFFKLYIISRGVYSIYRVSHSTAFSLVLGAFLRLYFIPLFIIFYFFTFTLGISFI